MILQVCTAEREKQNGQASVFTCDLRSSCMTFILPVFGGHEDVGHCAACSDSREGSAH